MGHPIQHHQPGKFIPHLPSQTRLDVLFSPLFGFFFLQRANKLSSLERSHQKCSQRFNPFASLHNILKIPTEIMRWVVCSMSVGNKCQFMLEVMIIFIHWWTFGFVFRLTSHPQLNLICAANSIHWICLKTRSGTFEVSNKSFLCQNENLITKLLRFPHTEWRNLLT